ncbi:hypothetical protein A3709_09460 [Halioglobus sp. HI00S01]|uniref:4-phosphoerythronate dehydrogenase n=1 Tax=Halioglobus sp. HI00S01 TaxID=1822214 RepID=UPI0007C212A6|nr:4-phosphoerythronate dehydrogenase [Halioglobus sp. HI00S01]KZX53351.1 hypothetical protein A3709_09460 [Halioglobus sp. HI00S01]
MTLSVVADENIPGVEALLGAGAEVTRVNGRSLQPEQLRTADALLVRSVTRVDAALIANTKVRFVGTATAGTDHIDQQALASLGVRFCSAPGSNANAVVEYVLAAIAQSEQFLECLLSGGVAGIVGFGHVGRLLARRFEALGIRWQAYDPWLDESDIPAAAGFAEILHSDVICVHAELTDAQPWPSRHLFDQAALAGLTSSQLLINASRGPVVDNQALLRRLLEDAAPHVVLDVWEREPQVDPQLLANVAFGTAHIAGYSLDGKLLATRMLLDAMADEFHIELSGGPGTAAPSLPLVAPIAPERAAAVRELLAQVYRIEEDDTLLRKAVAEAPEAIATAFDGLRRSYRVRRELTSATLQLLQHDALVATTARALGITCT